VGQKETERERERESENESKEEKRMHVAEGERGRLSHFNVIGGLGLVGGAVGGAAAGCIKLRNVDYCYGCNGRVRVKDCNKDKQTWGREGGRRE